MAQRTAFHCSTLAFLGRPGILVAGRPYRPARLCPVRLCVAGTQAASLVTVSTEMDENGASVSFSGPRKLSLASGVVHAVKDAGLATKKIHLSNNDDNDDNDDFTFILSMDEKPSDRDIDGLRSAIESVWQSAPEPTLPEKNSAREEEIGIYDILPLPDDAYEDGVYFHVDPAGHTKWITLTVVGAGKKQTYRKVLEVVGANKLDVIFCSLQSINDDCDCAIDVYHLTDMQGKTLSEAARARLHNDLVDALY